MKLLSVVVLSLLTISCNENLIHEEVTEDKILRTKTSDIEGYDYSTSIEYLNDSIKEVVYHSDNNDSVFYEQSYINGNLIRKGLLVNGLKTGVWSYFYGDNQLQKEIEFKLIKGKIYTNQIWNKTNSGENENHYSISDNVITYETPLPKANSVTSMTYFLIGKYNADFSNENKINVDTLLFNDNYKLTLNRKGLVRGVIIDERIIYFNENKRKRFQAKTYVDVTIK